VIISFPYDEFGTLDVPDENLIGVFGLPTSEPVDDLAASIAAALAAPVGAQSLCKLATGKRKVLIVADDVSRPTPVHAMLPPVLDALHAAGVDDDCVEFMLALGSHRFMTDDEIAKKLGADMASHYKAHNHDWKDPDACAFMGKTAEGVEVWVNKKVTEADLVIGIGRIMPIDICGFTGGGKILIPGVCGRITNCDMHWKRVMLPDEEVTGRRDNPIRKSIDTMARKAGLDFIVNAIMDGQGRVVDLVAGDMVEAHRLGCEKALKAHEVHIPDVADIVVVDGYPNYGR